MEANANSATQKRRVSIVLEKRCQGGPTRTPFDKYPSDDVICRSLASIREHGVAEPEQVQHQDHGRIHEHGRATDISRRDDLIYIIRQLVARNQVCDQYRVQEGTSGPTGRRQAQRSNSELPNLLPRSSER